MDLTTELAEQLDAHWETQLRPRLAGLTNDEYFWEPTADCWTVHRDGTVDFAVPAPRPEPVTTIAWRLAHVIVGVFAVRSHHHFGGPPASYQTWDYAVDAATALAQLDREYRRWRDGVRRLDAAALLRPVGSAEGPYADKPMVTLVLHINREVIHHGAEIALLRDLYARNNTHTEEN
jgi:hypothetical protein